MTARIYPARRMRRVVFVELNPATSPAPRLGASAVVASKGRAIGVWGTAARILIGLLLAGGVLYGHAMHGWPPVVLASLWWRARRNPGPMRATGPLGHAINVAVFLALYLTWWYAPAVDVLSDAALIFYGAADRGRVRRLGQRGGTPAR